MLWVTVRSEPPRERTIEGWKRGDEVIWRRAKSGWGRTGSERVRAVVERVTAARVRIRLLTGIGGSLTALVRADRLERAS
jgi:hypothetical protein